MGVVRASITTMDRVAQSLMKIHPSIRLVGDTTGPSAFQTPHCLDMPRRTRPFPILRKRRSIRAISLILVRTMTFHRRTSTDQLARRLTARRRHTTTLKALQTISGRTTSLTPPHQQGFHRRICPGPRVMMAAHPQVGVHLLDRLPCRGRSILFTIAHILTQETTHRTTRQPILCGEVLHLTTGSTPPQVAQVSVGRLGLCPRQSGHLVVLVAIPRTVNAPSRRSLRLLQRRLPKTSCSAPIFRIARGQIPLRVGPARVQLR